MIAVVGKTGDMRNFGLYILAVFCMGKEVMSCGQLTPYDTHSFTKEKIIFRAILPIAVRGKHLMSEDDGDTTLEYSLFTFLGKFYTLFNIVFISCLSLCCSFHLDYLCLGWWQPDDFLAKKELAILLSIRVI